MLYWRACGFGNFDLGGWFRLFWLFWGGLCCRFCLGVVTWVCVLGVLLVWWAAVDFFVGGMILVLRCGFGFDLVLF